MDLSLIHTLMLLLFCHFLFDFPLQGDYTALFKNPWHNGNNPIWVWPMTSHCVLHSVPVYLITGDFYLMAFMFLSHFMIDFIKCWNKISYHVDQLLHLLVIVFIALESSGMFNGHLKAF